MQGQVTRTYTITITSTITITITILLLQLTELQVDNMVRRVKFKQWLRSESGAHTPPSGAPAP